LLARLGGVDEQVLVRALPAFGDGPHPTPPGMPAGTLTSSGASSPCRRYSALPRVTGVKIMRPDARPVGDVIGGARRCALWRLADFGGSRVWARLTGARDRRASPAGRRQHCLARIAMAERGSARWCAGRSGDRTSGIRSGRRRMRPTAARGGPKAGWRIRGLRRAAGRTAGC
jgi:hypothetical protein